MAQADDPCVAIPSRAFVGMVVFGLIASLAIVPYTLLVLSGYEPPPNAPYEAIFKDEPFTAGDKLVLALASVFSVAITVFAWRGLLGRARSDVKLRNDLRERREAERSRPPPPPPPGYQ
jgi:hypothetical protein